MGACGNAAPVSGRAIKAPNTGAIVILSINSLNIAFLVIHPRRAHTVQADFGALVLAGQLLEYAYQLPTPPEDPEPVLTGSERHMVMI